MNKTQYLTTKEVMELHLILINRFGGSDGIRDLGLLASVLERPKTGYYDTLCEQAEVWPRAKLIFKLKYRAQYVAVDTLRSSQNLYRDAKPTGRDAMQRRQLSSPLKIL